MVEWRGRIGTRPNERSPADRRQGFAKALDRLAADPGPKVVMVVPASGYEHDVTVALPGLTADLSVLTTIVVAPFTPALAAVPEDIPEGFDARLTFDPGRAGRRTWPAIDPAHTGTRTNSDLHHDQVASAARKTLTSYSSLDPTLDLPDFATFADPAFARRAQELLGYLSHSFRPFEHLAASPAVDTSIPQLLRDVEEILGR